ncbi:MAG: D-2-hydroxyacid dehydrogenase [Lachnospiraceae bacterium]|nr:D-2-hydroxyacid dehydrogenase [Lachnospiraceae bacterium]
MEKLLVNLPEFNETQRQMIRKAADLKNYTAVFFDETEDALSEAADASVILSGNPALVPAAKKLRWFCAPSAGVDHFVRVWDAAPDQAILSNSSGAYGVTISEHIVLMLLELMRQREQYREIVSRREWVRNLPVRSILGSRITMLGTGDIGQETLKKLRGFRPACIVGVNRSGQNPGGMFDRVVPVSELTEVLPETEVLIMSLPGTKESTGLLSREMLSLLPDYAIIVNVGRGNSIDEEALLSELRLGRLFAALDVFSTEPLPQDSPFWDCPNLLLTPHISGNMTLPYTVQRICELFLSDFERFFRGEKPERTVDIRRGY